MQFGNDSSQSTQLPGYLPLIPESLAITHLTQRRTQF